MKTKRFLSIAFVLIGFVSFAAAQTTDENAASPQSDKPLKIKKKPVAKFRGADCSQSYGLTSIRVTFDKSAKVTATELVSSSGCQTFDNNAARAAQKITFDPALKNGETITVTKVVQYNFRVF